MARKELTIEELAFHARAVSGTLLALHDIPDAMAISAAALYEILKEFPDVVRLLACKSIIEGIELIAIKTQEKINANG